MADQAPTANSAVRSDDEKLKGAIAYVLSWLTGIIVLLIAGDNKFLKFHAWQSIIGGIAITIILIIIDFILAIAVVGICIGNLLGLLAWLYFLYIAYMVYTGKDYQMPIVADFVKKNFVK